MYNNLKAESQRQGISNAQLANFLGISETTLKRKLQSQSEWRINKIVKIQSLLSQSIQGNLYIDYLFAEG